MKKTLLALVIASFAFVGRAAGQTPAPAASVREANGLYTVTASFNVSQSIDVARAVLTDYERLPKFMPNVEKSVVTSRENERVIVEQELAGRLLMFSKRMHLRLEIHEAPGVIKFVDTCHGQFATYEGEWRVESSGGRTLVSYQLSAKPTFAVPPFVLARMMKRDADRLMLALQTEMASRAAR